ncbi:MAG: hypothetical protein AAF226_12510 [Verrucomicrobiota bacterium]
MLTLFRTILLLLVILLPSPLWAQFWNDYESPPHYYKTENFRDPMTLFLRDLKTSDPKGINQLSGKPLVAALLDEFNIPLSSQILVFTKTSLQRKAVHSNNPRALYFSEDVYLGWMPNGRVEVASMDPALGPVFFLQRGLNLNAGPILSERRSCLGCHAGSATNFLPGLLGQSVYADSSGTPLGIVKSFERIGHHIDYQDRWGGWFVSGQGQQQFGHLGNSISSRANGKITLDLKTRGLKDTDLNTFFPPNSHLTEGSDVLAMLVHDHQISAHYYINMAGYKVRQALHDSSLPLDSGRGSFTLMKKSSLVEASSAIDQLLDYFLFTKEPTLPAPVTGHGHFRKDFLKNQRTNSQGHSFKDLDLQNRLLKTRMSWMIYSRSFLGMPLAAREEFYHRLKLELAGKTQDYPHLPEDEKNRIFQILTETQTNLPSFWSP